MRADDIGGGTAEDERGLEEGGLGGGVGGVVVMSAGSGWARGRVSPSWSSPQSSITPAAEEFVVVVV